MRRQKARSLYIASRQLTESTENGTQREITLNFNQRLSFLSGKKKRWSVSILATFYFETESTSIAFFLVVVLFHGVCILFAQTSIWRKIHVCLSRSRCGPLNFKQCVTVDVRKLLPNRHFSTQHVWCTGICGVYSYTRKFYTFRISLGTQTTQFSSSYSPVFF